MKEIKKNLAVLVIDDEEGFRNLLHWELSGRGIHVETAQNGCEGIEMAARRKFDVIITDLTMPEMDGLTLLRKIKATAPETEVILVSGFSAVDTAVYAMKHGAFDFVLKPYDVEHLMARVCQAVERLSCGSCRRSLP